MSRRVLVPLAAFVVLGLAACGAAASTPVTQATATHPAPTATTKAKSWVTVQHWTGNQNQQTPNFQVTAGEQVVWSATPSDQYGGNFSITAYSSDGTYLALLANTGVTSPQHGTTTAHNTSEDYFDISALGCSYDIQVQSYQ